MMNTMNFELETYAIQTSYRKLYIDLVEYKEYVKNIEVGKQAELEIKSYSEDNTFWMIIKEGEIEYVVNSESETMQKAFEIRKQPDIPIRKIKHLDIPVIKLNRR